MKLGNVTLEELKALQEDRTCDISQGDAVALRRRSDAILKFYERISDNFPAIVAKLEAAQRLRDALDGQVDGIADAIDAFDAVVKK